jgi:1-acyl-sn-glycerol-3-phosphate acyltransferase
MGPGVHRTGQERRTATSQTVVSRRSAKRGEHPASRGSVGGGQPLRRHVHTRCVDLRARFLRHLRLPPPPYTLAHYGLFIGPLDGLLRRLVVIEASRENASAALYSDAVVLVFPGGDYDVYRPTLGANTVDFNGRTGYVRTAIEAGVPIVPMVSIGGQETQLFLTRGNWLARRLGLTKARINILPVSFGFPFGLTAILPPNLPLPAKIVTEVLEPIDVTARFGDDPDVEEVDAHVRSVMQTALERLSGQRRLPFLG